MFLVQSSNAEALVVYHLAIGDRSHSSWSMRAGLIFDRFDLPVTLHSAPMYTPAFDRLLTGFGGARTVPALRIEDPDGTMVLWDTLAIAEMLAERHPDRGLWPVSPAARALARSLVAEMHAGFGALRGACPMHLRRSYRGFAASPEVRADLARIEALWALAAGRRSGGGPWLCGAYCLADVFFAPVGPDAAAYVAAHLAEPGFLAWRAAGLAEPYDQPSYDLDLPERPWPGPVG